MAECRGLAPLARRHALVSNEARLACPVDIPNGLPSRSSVTAAEEHMVRVAGFGHPQVLQNSFPNQVVRYREARGTCNLLRFESGTPLLVILGLHAVVLPVRFALTLSGV